MSALRPGMLALVNSAGHPLDGRLCALIGPAPRESFRLPDGHMCDPSPDEGHWIVMFVDGDVVAPISDGLGFKGERMTVFGAGRGAALLPIDPQNLRAAIVECAA